MTELTSFPLRPTHTTGQDAYKLLFHHLHPSQPSGLTLYQQYDVYALVGGFGWQDVMDADDDTTMAMARRVEGMLAA